MNIKLVLFDIDGTLLLGTGKHPESFMECFKELYDVDVPRDIISGPTDLFILFKIMDAYNIDKTPDNINKIIAKTTEIFKTKDLVETKILPGVENLLKKLHSEKNLRIGLVTGNLQDVAFIKLKKFGLDHYFLKGGFGDKSDVRSDIINIAIKEFEDEYGEIDKSNIFIIGDAIHDIHAAKDAGVRTIAVATGKIPLDTLKKENPDYIFKDLTDTNKIIDVIQNG